MKKFISLLLVAVMMCVGLSSCGDEPTAEPAPLSVTTKVMSREYYEAHKDYNDFGIDQIILRIAIPTAEKLPIEVIFPLNIGIGLTFGRPMVVDEDLYNANLEIMDITGEKNKIFNVYTQDFKEFEVRQQRPTLVAYYGDIGINGEYGISFDEYFEAKTHDFTTLYLQVDTREEKSGSMLLCFNYFGCYQTATLYFATDGEYIAYSVKSVEAAQDALLKD